MHLSWFGCCLPRGSSIMDISLHKSCKLPLMFVKTSLYVVQCFKTKPTGLAYVEKWHHHLKVKDSQKICSQWHHVGFPENTQSIVHWKKKITKNTNILICTLLMTTQHNPTLPVYNKYIKLTGDNDFCHPRLFQRLPLQTHSVKNRYTDTWTVL